MDTYHYVVKTIQNKIIFYLGNFTITLEILDTTTITKYKAHKFRFY